MRVIQTDRQTKMYREGEEERESKRRRRRKRKVLKRGTEKQEDKRVRNENQTKYVLTIRWSDMYV